MVEKDKLCSSNNRSGRSEAIVAAGKGYKGYMDKFFCEKFYKESNADREEKCRM